MREASKTEKAMRIVLTAAAMLCTLAVPEIHVASASAEDAGEPTVKFTIPEHDFYPENIAYDPVSGCYFLGSMSHSRIIRIHEDGSYEDFVTGSEGGLLSSVGMKVDAERRALWVCTGRFSLMEDYDSLPAKTGVVRYDIDDGSLTGSWIMEEDQANPYFIFNDIVLASNGDAYATTTLFGRVYRIRADSGKMELFHQLPEGLHNNGIDFDPTERYLFMTVDRAISRLDTQTMELVELADPTGDALVGTDGLYFYEGSIISVKPRFKTVSRIYLDEGLAKVERVEILAQDRPNFAYPTTGAIVGDSLILVATSYADVPRNAESEDQHGELRILEFKLK